MEEECIIPTDMVPAPPLALMLIRVRITVGREDHIRRSEIELSQVRCAACGEMNDSGSQYCRKCARRLDEETKDRIEATRSNAVASQSTVTRWSALLITIVLAAVVIVIVLVLVLAVH